MAALFLAQASGLNLGLSGQLIIILASLVAAVGCVGVPEAGLVLLPLVLGSVGLPEWLVAAAITLFLPVDWLVARLRSAVNVMSDILVAIMLDGRRSPSANDSLSSSV
jgi:Na+/H+-dicarboxylate symporter